MKNEWITVAQAAELTGYHAVHIRRLVSSGEVVGKRWGGRAWMVSRDSLMDYVKRIEEKGEKRGPKRDS